MALITYAAYTALYAVPGAFTQAMVEEVIDRVSTELVRYLGRNFEGAAYTDVIDGTGSDRILVTNPPIRTLTSVAITCGTSTTTYTASSSPTLAEVFRWTGSANERGEIRFINSRMSVYGTDDYGEPIGFGLYPDFPEGFQNITVVYDGGYTTIPDDVLNLVSKLIAHELKRIGDDRTGRDLRVLSEGLGQYNYTLANYGDVEDAVGRLRSVFKRCVL